MRSRSGHCRWSSRSLKHCSCRIYRQAIELIKESVATAVEETFMNAGHPLTWSVALGTKTTIDILIDVSISQRIKNRKMNSSLHTWLSSIAKPTIFMDLVVPHIMMQIRLIAIFVQSITKVVQDHVMVAIVEARSKDIVFAPDINHGMGPHETSSASDRALSSFVLSSTENQNSHHCRTSQRAIISKKSWNILHHSLSENESQLGPSSSRSPYSSSVLISDNERLRIMLDFCVYRLIEYALG